MKEILAEWKILDPDGKIPYRSRVNDAAYDVYSIEDAVIPAHGMKNVGTGIAVAVPPGYYFTVNARSGLGRIGIIPMRGIIDSGYCGHLMVILTNQTNVDYHVKKGHRIAQLTFHEQLHVNFKQVDKFSSEYSSRGGDGQAGWGSSGH